MRCTRSFQGVFFTQSGGLGVPRGWVPLLSQGAVRGLDWAGLLPGLSLPCRGQNWARQVVSLGCISKLLVQVLIQKFWISICLLVCPLDLTYLYSWIHIYFSSDLFMSSDIALHFGVFFSCH